MSDYRIKTDTEDLKLESIKLLGQLGFADDGEHDCLGMVGTYKGEIFSDNFKHFEGYDYTGEIVTIEQLKDLVVLNRSDVGDATHYSECSDKILKNSQGSFIFRCGAWDRMIGSDHRQAIWELKPIEPKMSILDTGRLEIKEYLDKQEDGTYKLIKIDSRSVGDDSIEVSKGANFAYKENGELGIHIMNSELELVWQRHTQPEALPLIDDLPITEDFIFNPSINEQCAEIEKVRQKHSHYKKDVSHLDMIDVYRVLDLFDVTNPCLQHAIKKLLCAGHRGAKNTEKDIQEAIDTLNRYKQMRSEDGNS